MSALVLLLLLALPALSAFPSCTVAPLAGTSVCDFTLSPLERATALVGMMTLPEKFNNTVNASPGVPRLGIPPYNWWSEGLHGVASSPGVTFAPAGQNFSYATSFPEPILMSAAFDDALIYDVATTVSTEARAFNNAGRAGLDFWTPNINPVRDPRWGRSLETPGEDAYRTASYLYHLVSGLQYGGDDPTYQKLVATCKHFAAYDMEDWMGFERYGFDALVPQQDLVEYFLPSFKVCARDVNVTSIMCSYNALNGPPTCADDWLLQTVLREKWGWETDGLVAHYITSDCDAVSNIYSPHNYTSTPEQAVADALLAGTDLDCGTFYSEWLPSAYAQGLFNESIIDRALTRSYAAQFLLGYFDPPEDQVYRQLDWNAVNTLDAQALAYRAAWEGITLLKNDNDALPLDASSIGSIALVGPWANATIQMQGNYEGVAPYLNSPLYALQQRGFSVNYALGTNITSNSTELFAPAIAAAAAADITIYVGGIDTTVEAEAMDRTSIAWPGNQLDLVAQLSVIAKKLVVYQMGGGQIDDSSLVNNSAIGAILWGGYPGQDGGVAMMDILFGDQAPAGRLPLTQYPADYVTNLNMTDMTLRPSATNPGRTYRWYTGTAVFPYGYGLHYTTFTKTALTPTAQLSFQSAETVAAAQAYGGFIDAVPVGTFSVAVKNTGTRTSDYVALFFLQGEFGPTPYPLKSLVGYNRLSTVRPGQEMTIDFVLTLGAISRVDAHGDTYLYPGTYELVVDTIDPMTVATFTVGGNATLIDAWPQPPASQIYM